MAFERKKKEVVLSESKVVEYKSKIDYLQYTDNENEARELLNLEHQVIFCSGKIEEMRQKRWEALTQMRLILKKDGSFSEVMKLIGISKDMIYDINNREKLFVKYEVDRQELAKLPTRIVRDLVKEDFGKDEIIEIVKAENFVEKYKSIKEDREKVEEVQVVEFEEEKRKKEILDKIKWHEKEIKKLKKEYDSL